MIKHIVMWKLKAEAHGLKKEQLAAKIKNDLEALRDVIPEIHHLEVGSHELAQSDASCDVCLYSEFTDAAALSTYQNHPAHQAVVAFVRDAVTARYVVDYSA